MSDDQIDSMLADIDELLKSTMPYEPGLPVEYTQMRELMRNIVKQHLTQPAPVAVQEPVYESGCYTPRPAQGERQPVEWLAYVDCECDSQKTKRRPRIGSLWSFSEIADNET